MSAAIDQVLDLIGNMTVLELSELKKKYAGDRRTRVADDASREMTDEDLIADEDVVVTISGRGYIKRQPVDTYRRQHRHDFFTGCGLKT